MCLHVDSLPNELLLVIFDLIPLSDLLRLDRVCHSWANLLTSACARRRTLVLIGGDGRPMDEMYFRIPFNNTFEVSFDGRQPYFDLPVAERNASLTLPNVPAIDDHTEGDFTEMVRLNRARLSGQLATYFKDLFPNVDTLVVINSRCDEDELHSVIDLVGPVWKLDNLKLWLRTSRIDDTYYHRPHQHPVRTLLHSINQQSSLRQLTLDIDGLYHLAFSSESCSFIAQLKVVKLFLFQYDNTIWDTVQRFDSLELRHIDLGLDNLPSLDVALNPKFKFTPKVCQLYWNWNFETVERFGEFCWRFRSLTSLEMHWSPAITFTQLVTNLASLSQLTHLKLEIRFHEQPVNAFALVDRFEVDHESPRTISLPSVKILELFTYTKRSHYHFESLSPFVFPSVEVIILKNFSGDCTICQPKITGGQYDLEVGKRCHRLLILSLKNKFANNSAVRFYGRDCGLDGAFVDWSDYVPFEDEDLPKIGDVMWNTKKQRCHK